MQNKLLKEYFTPQELKQMGVDPFAMGDVSSFQRKQTIAPPTAKPKNLSSLVLDYAEQSPTALRVSGGDPLKNLINFAADYVPGLSLEKAKREQDALGQNLAMLSLLPGAAIPVKAIKGVRQIDFSTAVNRFKTNNPKSANYDKFVETKSEFIQGKMQKALNDSSIIQDPKNKAKYLKNTIREIENQLVEDFGKSGFLNK